jgi:hypothetical protein
MNGKIVIVVLVHFMLVCAPMFVQSAALNHSNQLLDIDRELFQACLKKSSLRMKSNRTDQGRLHAKLQQDNLLRELLTSEAILHEPIQKAENAEKSPENCHENDRQERRMLEEILTETSSP